MNTLADINHHITYFLYAAFWQSSKSTFAAVKENYNNAHKYTQCWLFIALQIIYYHIFQGYKFLAM